MNRLHPRLHPPFARTFSALVLFCAIGSAGAQTLTAPVVPSGSTAAPTAASVPTGKLVSTFSSFAGSAENSASLINGLRSGSVITLSSPSGGTSAGESLSFSAPTRPMGYGNVRIAMSLAEAQLAGQGISNPTPTQLQGALTGTATTQGILQMRAAGMGWGQIAKLSGFRLGAVISGKQVFTQATAGSSAAGAGTTRGQSGIATAGGGSVNSGGSARSQVVTAAGGSGQGSGQVTTGLGHGHGAGASSGVVSAAGGNAGAGGQGAGHGKGGGKP